MRKRALSHPLRTLAVLGALFGTLACSLIAAPAPDATTPSDSAPSGDPQVTLAAPLEGAVYQSGVAVNVLARITNAGEDIDRVELVVDDEIVSSLPAPNPAGAPEFTVAQSWTSEGNGPRTIGLTVFRSDGSSTPVTRTIEVVDPNMMAAAPPANDTDNGQTGIGSIVEQQPTESDNMGETVTPEETAPEPEQPPAEEPEPTEPEPEEPEPTEPEPEEPEPTATPSRPTATLLVGANIRSGPSTEFIRIGSYAANTQTEALAVNSARTWYKIKYYNGEGWIAADLVDVTNAESLPIDDGPPLPTPVPTQVPPTEPPPANVNLVYSGDVNIDPFPPDCGQTMEISVTVRNDGSSAAGSTSALLIRDIHIDSGTTTDTRAPIPDLGPGESATIGGAFLTVDTNFDSRHRIEITIDADGQVNESNEDDNRYTSDEYDLDKGDC